MAQEPFYILLQPQRGSTMMVNDEQRKQELTQGGGFQVADVVYDAFDVEDTMKLVEAEWEEKQKKKQQQADPDSLFDPQGQYNQIPIGEEVNLSDDEEQVILENIDRLRDFEPDTYSEVMDKIEGVKKWKTALNPGFFQPDFFEERRLKRAADNLVPRVKQELKKRGLDTDEQSVVNEFDLPSRLLTQEIDSESGHAQEQLDIYGRVLPKIRSKNESIFGSPELNDEQYQALQTLNQNERLNATQAATVADTLEIDESPQTLANLSKDELFEVAGIDMNEVRQNMPSEEEKIQSAKDRFANEQPQTTIESRLDAEPSYTERDSSGSFYDIQQPQAPQQQEQTQQDSEPESTYQGGSTYFGATQNYSDPPSLEPEYRNGASPEDEGSYNNNNMAQNGISTVITQQPTTVDEMAQKYGMDTSELRRYNGSSIQENGSIPAGANLMIPFSNFQDQGQDQTNNQAGDQEPSSGPDNLLDGFDDNIQQEFLVQFHRKNGEKEGPIYLVNPKTKQLTPFGSNQSDTWDALLNRFPDYSKQELKPMIENAKSKVINQDFGDYNRVQPGEGIDTSGNNQADADDIDLDEVKKAYGENLTQHQLEYGQNVLNQTFKLAKQDPDVSNTDIEQMKSKPGLMTSWLTAVAAGGYGTGDIIRDIKRREAISNGDEELRDVQVISQTKKKSEFQSTREYKDAIDQTKLALPQNLDSDIDPSLFNKSIYQLPDSFFEAPTPTVGSEEWNEKADQIKVMTADAAIKRIEARTEQEVAMAQHEFEKAKEKAERELGVKLENDAMSAWQQLEQLESSEKRNVVESGMVDEARDRYLREMRNNLNKVRDEYDRKSRERRVSYLMQYGTPEEIKSELSKEERKKLGFTPSQEFKDYFSKENLRERYPNYDEEDYDRIRSAVFDKNGNFRSNAYFTAMTDILKQEDKKDKTQQNELLRREVQKEQQAHEEDMETWEEVGNQLSDGSSSEDGTSTDTSELEFSDLRGSDSQDTTSNQDTTSGQTSGDQTTGNQTPSPSDPTQKEETDMDEFDRAIETTRLNLIRDGASQKKYDTMMSRIKQINNNRRESGGEALRIGDAIDNIQQERQSLSDRIAQYDQGLSESAQESRKRVEETLKERNTNNYDDNENEDTYQPDDFGQSESSDVAENIRDSYSPSDDDSDSSSNNDQNYFYAYRPGVDEDPTKVSVADSSKVDDYIKQWNERSGVDWAGRNKEDFPNN